MTLPQEVGSGGGGILMSTSSNGSTTCAWCIYTLAREDWAFGGHDKAWGEGALFPWRTFFRRRSIWLSLLYAVSWCLTCALGSRGKRSALSFSSRICGWTAVVRGSESVQRDARREPELVSRRHRHRGEAGVLSRARCQRRASSCLRRRPRSRHRRHPCGKEAKSRAQFVSATT